MNWHCHQLNNDFSRLTNGDIQEAYENLIRYSTPVIVREWQIKRRPDYSTKIEARRIPFFAPGNIPEYERIPSPDGSRVPRREETRIGQAALIDPMKDPPTTSTGRVTKKALRDAPLLKKSQTTVKYIYYCTYKYIIKHIILGTSHFAFAIASSRD